MCAFVNPQYIFKGTTHEGSYEASLDSRKFPKVGEPTLHRLIPATPLCTHANPQCIFKGATHEGSYEAFLDFRKFLKVGEPSLEARPGEPLVYISQFKILF